MAVPDEWPSRLCLRTAPDRTRLTGRLVIFFRHACCSDGSRLVALTAGGVPKRLRGAGRCASGKAFPSQAETL